MNEQNLTDGHQLSPQPKKQRLDIKTDIRSNDYWRRSAEKFHLVVACTGSVASIKIPELLQLICNDVQKAGKQFEGKLTIRVVATENALRFFNPDEVEFPVFNDEDEWIAWQKRGDPVIHIELRKWADMMVIAPLDANTLAKIANGLCDNLLTSLVRAWDVKKPLYFCPAMNTHMWEHPLTVKQVELLKGLMGFKEIPCIEKDLMCGDRGYGAMASLPMISSVVVSELKKHYSIYSG